MAAFRLHRTTTAPPAAVWSVLTDFGGYGRWMPLTTMRCDPGAPEVGWSFAGLSGLGPIRLRDAMTVTHWEPPEAQGAGAFAVVKTGRPLGGWARVRLEPAPGGGTAVAWAEEIRLRPAVLGRVTAPLADTLGARLFARALQAMLAAASTGAVNRRGWP